MRIDTLLQSLRLVHHRDSGTRVEVHGECIVLRPERWALGDLDRRLLEALGWSFEDRNRLSFALDGPEEVDEALVARLGLRVNLLQSQQYLGAFESDNDLEPTS